MLFRVLTLILCLSISACSSWVYRLDMPQGNYLVQKDIDKLQLNMTKEQVKFVLGSPVIVDSFHDDTWHYVYRLKSGKGEKHNVKKQFTVVFENGHLVSASGDFELPESYNTPIEN
ncbi:outer membrane protein assembly factor BamE [Colwellia sp. RE-S-Sl-9]